MFTVRRPVRRPVRPRGFACDQGTGAADEILFVSLVHCPSAPESYVLPVGIQISASSSCSNALEF